MAEQTTDNTSAKHPEWLRTMLTRLAQLGESQTTALLEQNRLARDRTQTTSNLALYASKTSENAETQTGLAAERTALTREQTRLSTRSTELAQIRTEMARERTEQAEERTRLAVQRTDMAQRRVMLAEERTHLAERRNALALDRTTMAGTRTELAHQRTATAVTRTRLSMQRTELARERTALALIRTGLALFTLGVTFLRYFGVSRWTIFDAALILLSFAALSWGGTIYRRALSSERSLQSLISSDRALCRALTQSGT